MSHANGEIVELLRSIAGLQQRTYERLGLLMAGQASIDTADAVVKAAAKALDALLSALQGQQAPAVDTRALDTDVADLQNAVTAAEAQLGSSTAAAPPAAGAPASPASSSASSASSAGSSAAGDGAAQSEVVGTSAGVV